MRIGVLASGAGSILEALVEAALPIEIVVVDRECRAIEVARDAGLHVEMIERTDFSPTFDRDGYTDLVLKTLSVAEVDLIVMAGYGTVLGEAIHATYAMRILNTHPALLPSFKGWHAVRDALAFGAKVTGCTVHVATLEVDDGPILAQQAVEILPCDTESSLHERIKAIERVLYPATIREVLDRLENGGSIA